ncbi:PAS domain-containing sensor histidine kinase [Parabacteroides sp. AM08-6]|uniref:sensor histidine kinase n=1 Tax=Parabacteroides sp. AM08-6 TaxID=2292053 RepID=UPI000EFDEB7D|nr:ATP-binding protein [Parabacteroides sp. AM08-6]RHJ83240.1 GHKL domain-containing protein [Parabacteroides sp. AM08-6]
MLKKLYHNFHIRLSLLIGLTVLCTYLILEEEWSWLFFSAIVWLHFLRLIVISDKRYAQKVAFMFDAIDNSDYAFQYATRGRSSNDKMVSQSLNRITQILFQAKADAIQKEKYYELILNSVNTGIIVLDDSGFIYQTNNEALRLLGLTVFTNVRQLERIDKELQKLIINIQPGNKQQISFTNERGAVNLSIRVSEMTLQDKHVRILAINDINSELDEKEIDSWIRLTRVLTHEIMNSVTPITSLSDTLLSIHEDANNEIRNGLEVISTTGKSLISFVESYRKFTHIPTPEPTLFYVLRFAERMVKLAQHHINYPNIRVTVNVQPSDLIVYADENLISQVVLNLLKNAMQAIGPKQEDGHIELKAYCNEEEAVLIEVSNNGPAIPPEEVEHIFVPFFTTKEGGSGIGLSISRQIMRLSGGSIALKSVPAAQKTTFILTFP